MSEPVAILRGAKSFSSPTVLEQASTSAEQGGLADVNLAFDPKSVKTEATSDPAARDRILADIR